MGLSSDLVTPLMWPKKRQDKLDLLEKQPEQPICSIPFSTNIYNLVQTDGNTTEMVDRMLTKSFTVISAATS